MNIPKDMIINSFEHRYAGDGWAVVEAYPDEWARVVSVGKHVVGHQFFLVWSKLLKTEKEIEKNPDGKWKKTDRNLPLHPNLLKIRNDLQSGKKIIKDTRLVVV